MKSILIPTVFESDTLHAIDTAIKHARGKSCTIVLLTLTEAPDAGSAAEFLRKTRRALTQAQSELLNECYNAVALSANCSLDVHHQYGLSAALLRNLLQYLGTDMVILSPSYKAEKKRIHTYFCKLVSTCKKPILHLGSRCGRPAFNKALYLESNNARIGIKELQQLVNRQFDFKIVSQASVAEDGYKDFAPFVNEAIERNGIDLLIETRKSKKAVAEKAVDNDAFGLPMLSIHEEAARI
ncbi:hypothetical protein HYN59_06800 [Flavobacterium album]|uniref:UspA domain-containing protein n=1 Tax=Flavobacterium album TaxID=2175091 RepID=A0A2S1QWS4_9FLAO|nr:hypothetical protein [Flavobacterium album]AWH84852.1 hypothetical protein HYN59_06800 [Flavobacterium album]